MKTGERATCSLLFLCLAACTTKAGASGLCDDGGKVVIPSDVDAGPVDVSIGPSGGDGGGSPHPDPSTWGCYTDRDCAVFPNLPYCDGNNRCTAATGVTSCEAGARWFPPRPEIQHTYAGSNGTFTDSCDSDGNLLAYQCTSEQVCTPGVQNGCDGPLANSGSVSTPPNKIDCLGTCRDGRCDARCPEQGDLVTLLEANGDGSTIMRNESDGRTYECTPGGTSNAGYCTALRAGQSGIVSALGLQAVFCTGPSFGGIVVALSGIGSCDYSCSIVKLPSCGP